MRILLLGGTSEAAELAQALAARRVDAIYSYAGRVLQPAPQPIPVRQGGFGGAEGLARALRQGGFTHLVDATHPFAARISANAQAASRAAGVPLIRLARAPWQPEPEDDWTEVADEASAAASLPDTPSHVFLAIGRQHLAPFAAKPWHDYLLRLVDPPDDLPLPRVTLEIARGPFDVAGDTALMRRHGTQLLVCRNSGGEGAKAKLIAARALRLPVLMIARPQDEGVHSVAAALAALGLN